MFFSSPIRLILATGLCVLTLNAAADDATVRSNAGMRYAAVNIQSDSENNRQFTGVLSLTAGNHSWVQVGGGTLHIQQQNNALNPSLINLGVGVASQQLSASLTASQRKDGDKYQQQDWNGTLDWHNNKVGLGIDGLHRNMELRGTVPMANNQGTIANVPASQTLNGYGVGLHAHINLTEQLIVAMGGMHYNYESTTHQDAGGTSSGSNSGLFNTVLNPVSTQVSGVTRETAVLQRSWNAGIAYRLPKVALMAQYFNDKAIDNSGTLTTTQLCAAIFINEHWVLSPGIGHSTKNPSGGATFGVLTARYGW